MNEEVTYILRCLCATLIGRGVLDAYSFSRDLERYARAWSNIHGTDSPVLTDFLQFLKNMAAEKRDVDAKITVSRDVVPGVESRRH